MTVPMIPHPYTGKLVDKLSQDVMINDKPAATKGSKSKFDTPGHICMPPGVKFKKNPNNEGEVSSGTVSNVKINDKEAAVLGSMVKTCNDPQPQETCTIIAVGAPVVLPIMMPGMDPDQFKKDGGTRFNTATPITTMAKTEQSRKTPKLQNPEWSNDTPDPGEEVILSVELVDQYENANVTFKVWEAEADREKETPLAVLKARNKDNKAEAKWRYSIDSFAFKSTSSDIITYLEEKMGVQIDTATKQHIIDDYKQEYDNPIKKAAEFIFTVKSFRCEEQESGTSKIGSNHAVIFRDQYGSPLKGVKYSIIGPDGEERSGETSEDGRIDEQVMIPGKHQIKFEYPEEK
jgi:uncharacterized Zn-binding protein involved in type VI secretion